MNKLEKLIYDAIAAETEGSNIDMRLARAVAAAVLPLIEKGVAILSASYSIGGVIIMVFDLADSINTEVADREAVEHAAKYVVKKQNKKP